jgi:hypothetical protein
MKAFGGAWRRMGLLLAVAGAMAAPVRGQEPTNPACFDNAAWSYWKAQAKLQPILTREHLDAVLFAENQLGSLPPKAFAYRPEAGRWLIREKGMLAELHRAASMTHCAFNPLPESGLPMDFSHRDILRDVWKRALAAAKAFEFVEQHDAAVSVYLDLFKLLDHMDDDEDWASAYVALSWLPELVYELEGFFSRFPPRLAVQPLADYLAQRRQQPIYPMRAFMRREMRTYASWLLEDLAQTERRLISLYKGREPMPAVEGLLGLEDQAKRERLAEWLSGYQKEVLQLAESLEKPYPQAVEAIRAGDERIRAMAEDPDLAEANPLVPLLMPPMERTYQEFVAAETAYALVEILAVASVYRDFVGDWPDDIPMIEQFGTREFPPDPFTGQPIGYTVRKSMPRVDIAIPQWLEQRGSVFAVADLARRVENDQASLDQWVRSITEQERQQARRAEQAASAGENAGAEELSSDDRDPVRDRLRRVRR